MHAGKKKSEKQVFETDLSALCAGDIIYSIPLKDGSYVKLLLNHHHHHHHQEKRGGSILTLENVHIQKGIILSGCSLSSCMHRMVNIGRGHALNHMSGSAQTSTASKHHWK
jgi:hypothetical protein